MTDFTGCLCLKKCLQSSALTNNSVQLFHAWVMYLVQVNVIGSKIAKALLNVCCHGFSGSCHTLGGNYKFVTNSFKGITKILLADRIASGCIDIIHTLFCQLLH